MPNLKLVHLKGDPGLVEPSCLLQPWSCAVLTPPATLPNQAAEPPPPAADLLAQPLPLIYLLQAACLNTCIQENLTQI